MRLVKIIQFLMLALITIGIFASMARNSYGFTLMGTACLGIAMLYFAQLFWKLIGDFSALESKDVPALMELFALGVLAILAGLRIFYIGILYVDVVVMIEGFLLLLTYALIARNFYRQGMRYSLPLARVWLSFFSFLLLFIAAGLVGLLRPDWSIYLGLTALLLSLPFVYSLLRGTRYDHAGKSSTLLDLLISSQHKIGLLTLVLAGLVIYGGLVGLGWIPKINDMTQSPVYLQLINQAETRQEKPVNGKYKHEFYKEAADKFLKRVAQ